MNIIKKTLAGLLVVFLAFGQVTVIPGDWVQGFSSLTTAGSNVYVTGVGTIGQDTSFTRSAAGRYTLYDATPTTGVTTLTVRAGTGQSSTNLGNFIASNGTTYAGLANNGTFFSTDYVSALSSPVFVLAAGTWNTRGLAITSDFPILWSNSTTNSGSTKDLGLARDAAGRLRISNGSTGLGQIMIASSTPASAAATCAAGTVVWDSGFVYVCVAKDTWKRAAIATW